jgi:flagellar biosynthesis GTPase FlhF
MNNTNGNDFERKKREEQEEAERRRKKADDDARKKAEDDARKKADDDARKKKLQQQQQEEEEKKKRKALDEERKQLQDMKSKIDKMIHLQSTTGTMTSTSDGLVVDKKYKLTPQEAAENEYIRSDPLLLSFNNYMQSTWNQSFIAASVIGTNQLSLQNNSKTVTTLNILSQLSSNLLFASVVFSGAALVVSSINSAHKEIEFKNLAALVPTSDAVDMGILSSAIARHFTLSYHDEIKNSAYSKTSSKSFTKMKEMFKSAIDRVDSKLARSFTCRDGLDWLAADMSRICMSYIFNCDVLKLSQLVVEVTTDRSVFTKRLVDLVKSTYPVSKPMIISISKSVASGGGLTIIIYITIHHHHYHYYYRYWRRSN